MDVKLIESIVYGSILALISFNAYPHGGDTTLIHACVDTQNTLKYSAPDLECAAGETAVHWSIQGPPGPVDPALLGRVDALEAQVAALQDQVADLVAPTLPSVIVSNASLAEGASGSSTFSFTISLNMPSSDTVVINYATQDGTAVVGDYSSTSGKLVYLPGETSKVVSVTVHGDTVVETDEAFYLQLSGVVNADASGALGTGTIINDDLPTVSIAGPTTGAEGDQLTYTITLSTSAFVPVSVDYAAADGTATLANNDYASSAGTVVFSPGQTMAQVSVQTISDAVAEGQEDFSVALSNAIGAVISGAPVVTAITDSDLRLSISNASVIEGNTGNSPVTTMQMTVALSKAVSGSVSFRYGPSSGGSATPAGWTLSSGDVKVIPFFSTCHADTAPSTCPTITFVAGETQKVISIQVVGDKLVEPNENFFVKIFDSAGSLIADDVGEGIIINDD